MKLLASQTNCETSGHLALAADKTVLTQLGPLGDIADRSLHYVVHGKGERWVELAPQQAGCFQGRRDDRAGCNARRCAGRRWGKLGNRETCDLEGPRDHGVRIERVIGLPLFTFGNRSFGRTVQAFDGGS